MTHADGAPRRPDPGVAAKKGEATLPFEIAERYENKVKALAAEVALLTRERDEVEARRATTLKALDASNATIYALKVAAEGAQGEVNALREEVKRLGSAPAIGALKRQAVEGLANEAADGVRAAVRKILGAGIEEHKNPPGVYYATAEVKDGKIRTRPLELDDAPAPPVAPKLATPPQAIIDDANAKETTGRTARALPRCEKCGKFKIGNAHKC